MVNKTARSSNFELLRIICIVLIIAFHYCTYGNNGVILKSEFSINQLISIIFGSWGLLGVDCFVFISAYFLIGTNNVFSIKKLVKILVQTTFYSSFIIIFLYLTGIEKVGKMGLIMSVLSPILNFYWFVTTYCMLYTIFPFLNKLIHSIGPKYLSKFLIILTLFILIYATILKGNTVGDLLFFIYLYLLMGYLKSNSNNWFEVHASIGFWITSICIILFNVSMSILGTFLNLSIIYSHASYFVDRYSLVMVLDAIFLFYIFKNSNVKNSNIINTVASTTLGIYLFHENPYLRKVLWDNILKIHKVYFLPTYIIYFLISTISIFVLGVIIDLLRINLLEKPLFGIKVKCIEKFYNKIDSWMIDSK